MARREIIVLTDDIDNTEDGTVRNIKFGLEGTEYEIDLRDKNAAKLFAALQPFLDNARIVKHTPKQKGAQASTGELSSRDKRAAREFGKLYCATVSTAKVKSMSDRGRVPAEVTEAWKEAGRPDRATCQKMWADYQAGQEAL